MWVRVSTPATCSNSSATLASGDSFGCERTARDAPRRRPLVTGAGGERSSGGTSQWGNVLAGTLRGREADPTA